MTWTDLPALAAAMLRTTSREEALALVHDAPPMARPVLPGERRADPVEPWSDPLPADLGPLGEGGARP